MNQLPDQRPGQGVAAERPSYPGANLDHAAERRFRLLFLRRRLSARFLRSLQVSQAEAGAWGRVWRDLRRLNRLDRLLTP